MKNAYTLNLVSACNPEAATRLDAFRIDRDAKPVFEILMSESEDSDPFAKVKRLSALQPHDMPGVCSGVNLISLVNEFLFNALTESDGLEFFGDLFLDDDGHRKPLPINFIPA